MCLSQPLERQLLSKYSIDTSCFVFHSDNQLNSKNLIESDGNNTTLNETSSSSTWNIHPIQVLDVADEVRLNNEDQTKTSSKGVVKDKNRSQTPLIIIFDSLRAGSKTRVAATLREFLQLEYDHKKPLPVESLARKIFNLDTIPSIEAAVPQQPNYFDCGLYILQYIENFFANRSSTVDFQSPATFTNWCEKHSMGSSKRKQIFDIINQHVV